MITDTSAIVRNFLRDLFRSYNALQHEKNYLQNATARIAAINTTVQAIQDEAQKALDRLNALEGTSLTLADVRKLLGEDN